MDCAFAAARLSIYFTPAWMLGSRSLISIAFGVLAQERVDRFLELRAALAHRDGQRPAGSQGKSSSTSGAGTILKTQRIEDNYPPLQAA